MLGFSKRASSAVGGAIQVAPTGLSFVNLPIEWLVTARSSGPPQSASRRLISMQTEKSSDREPVKTVGGA